MANSAAVNLSRQDHYEPGALDAPDLDLLHLSQTFGVPALETELLTLFDRKAAQFSDRLRASRGMDDGRADRTRA